jgi:hypothetical protein
VQQPKSMGGFGNFDEPFSGSSRGTIQTKPKEEANMFISKEQEPPVAVEPPNEVPTPLPLEEHQIQVDKASESSGTPEFKFGAGGANAQLPQIEDQEESKLLMQMDKAENL